MALDPRRSPLVGRDHELAELVAVLGLDGGPPGAVVLGGDAGVGKTRLLAAVRERADAAGWRTVVGHCLDFGDSALPYLAVTEVLGRLAQDEAATVESTLSEHPALARLLPRQRLRAEDGPSGGTASRAEVVEAVAALLTAVAEHRPLLLVVEDAHWADQATRELLTSLLSRRGPAPLALVVTYRSDDVHRRHPLRPALAQWTRLPGVHRSQLERLDDDAVRRLVTGLLARLGPAPATTAGRDLVRAVVERAEGNAFFAEELASAAAREAVPDDLADLLLVRLDRLGDAARQVVRVAAAGGRVVGHPLLAAVTADLGGGAADPVGLDASLREAVDQHVLVPTASGGYAFRHALLAEAAYDDLLPGERVRLHAAYVAALVSGAAPGTAAELARHARAAGDQVVAARAAAEAGDEAMRVGAPEDATALYLIALELTARSGPAREALTVAPAPDWAAGPDDGPDPHVVLVLRTATALSQAGFPDRGLALLHDEARSGDAAEPLDRARLLVAVAAQVWLTDSDLDPLPFSSEAVTLVPDAPSALRARVLVVHALATTRLVDPVEGRALARQARTLAEEVGLGVVAAEASVALARAEDLVGDTQAALRRLDDVLAAARSAGDATTQIRVLHQTASLRTAAGEPAAATAAYLEAARCAEDIGRPWAPYALDSRVLAGLALYAGGDWDGALALVDVGTRAPAPIARGVLDSVRLAVLTGRGAPDAGALAGSRAAWGLDGMAASIGGGAAVDRYGDAHDVEGMLAAHDEAVGHVTRLYPVSVPWVQVRLTALVLGQLAGAVPRTASADHAGLLRAADRVLAAGAAVWEAHDLAPVHRREVRVWRDRALAERRRLAWVAGVDAPDEEELVAAWRTAADGFAEHAAVYETARSRARLAAVLRAVGDQAGARAEAARAREVAQRLRAEPVLLELRGLGGATRRGPAPEAGGRPVLTDREREVLALVAEGLSNGEVGRRLFISTKTVSVHVSNVLAKLGAAGRTEAVAVARREGLLG